MDFNRKKERLLGNETGHFPKKSGHWGVKLDFHG